MNRKGAEELLWNIILILILLFVAGSIFAFESDQSSGKAIKDELTAKQTAMLIDAARPGTTIFIGANVSIDGNKVKSGNSDYSFFSKNKISYKTADGGTEIKIE